MHKVSTLEKAIVERQVGRWPRFHVHRKGAFLQFFEQMMKDLLFSLHLCPQGSKLCLDRLTGALDLLRGPSVPLHL